MAKILVCNPEFYGINYSINPWMDVNNQANKNLAIKQWNDLVKILKEIGVEVFEMSGVENLPDLVFTANAGFINHNSIILSNFKYPERQPEKAIYSKWFFDNNMGVFDLRDGVYFEGAGDHLKFNDTIYCGYGFRSDELNFDSPIPRSFSHNYISLKLIDPYFYHLDTCFCPLPNNFALIYLPAIENHDVIKHLKLLYVPEEEAKKFACNAVCVDNNIIIPSGCPKTKEILEYCGFKVYDTDMSEFIKSGGACRCLTLQLDN